MENANNQFMTDAAKQALAEITSAIKRVNTQAEILKQLGFNVQFTQDNSSRSMRSEVLSSVKISWEYSTNQF